MLFLSILATNLFLLASSPAETPPAATPSVDTPPPVAAAPSPVATAPAVKTSVLRDGRDLDTASSMGKYLYSKDAFQAMYAVAVQADRTLKISCNSEYQIKPLVLAVLSPIIHPETSQHPTDGVWTYRFDAIRCGTAKTYNLLMTARQGQRPRTDRMVPGHTIASPLLMKDTFKVAAPAVAHALGRNCKELLVFDTALTKAPHTLTEKGRSYPGAWMERWTFQGCGKHVSQAMTFVPDGKGGTYITAKN